MHYKNCLNLILIPTLCNEESGDLKKFHYCMILPDGKRPRTDMVKKACSYKSITQWNALENQRKSICDSDAFKKSLRC